MRRAIQTSFSPIILPIGTWQNDGGRMMGRVGLSRSVVRVDTAYRDQHLSMNYFAHALRFLDRPYFVAGTAVPDWLSVADRQVRVRAKLIDPYLLGDGSPQAEVAAGAWQHLHDDGWFHSTRAFFEVSTSLAVSFREVLGPDDSHRTSFLGHIVTELLIDAELIERNPGQIERYYEVLRSIEPLAVQTAVNAMAKTPTECLAPLIPRFIEERFLPDYLNDER